MVIIVDNAVDAESLVIRRLVAKMDARVESGERSLVIIPVSSTFQSTLEFKAS